MASNEYYDSTGVPQPGAFSSAAMRAEFALVKAGFDKLPTLLGNAGEVMRVNSTGTALDTATLADIVSAIAAEMAADKNASNGYAGLEDWKVQLMNNAGTIMSYLQNEVTAARAWTLQDRDGTLADNTDLALLATIDDEDFTGSPTAPTQAIADDSTKIATTAWIRNNFDIVNANPGRIRFPSGLTIQFGSIVTDASSPYDATDSFHTAFTAAPSWKIAVAFGVAGRHAVAGAIGASQITVISSLANTTVYWVAIGMTAA